LLDHWLQHKIKFKIFLISKSGSTLEVIVNFSVILDKFKKNCKNWQDYFVIISDNDSDFAKFALTNNLTFFPIKKNVGGRFSLFTAASMVPLGCIGVDIEKIKNSAKNVIEKFFANSTNDDYENIILQATYKYAAYSAQKNLNNLFIFDQSAYYLGQWYRQLFAESLVKSDKINFVPTVSLAVDLHSMTQLYLAGDDIWWTIFLKANFQKYSKIDVVNLFMDNKLKYLDYQNILFSSVCEAFEEQKRSYTILNCSNEESIGQICVSWILEVLLLSIVFKVNPFDQPAVEYYKKNIYKKLKK
jgi:glucose-6-phosphate isomerase